MTRAEARRSVTASTDRTAAAWAATLSNSDLADHLSWLRDRPNRYGPAVRDALLTRAAIRLGFIPEAAAGR